MLALLRRSWRYQCWDADPRIYLRTHFFAAAAVVTRVLARRATLSRFLFDLSTTLEAENARRAREICAGALYSSRAIESNTLDFVRHEQAIVQAHLDQLRRDAPRCYAREIHAANEGLELVRWRGLRRFADHCFVSAVAEARCSVGGRLDFAEQRCRELLGIQIALHAVAQQGRRERAKKSNQVPN
jgi:hypothetical protein